MDINIGGCNLVDKVEGWRYYNHAMLPTTPPHQEVNLSPIKNHWIWKTKEKEYFARWTSDYDCGCETEWWYCIKDEPFEYEQVRSNYRTKIRHSLKMVEARIIKPVDYAKELCEIMEAVYKDYPVQYRPVIDHERMINNYKNNPFDSQDYWGVFSLEEGRLFGFGVYTKYKEYIEQTTVKMHPEFLSLGGNTALVYYILHYYLNSGKYRYVCNGERNIVHQTRYTELLIENFSFRKAYCKLSIIYPFCIRFLIGLIYQFRKLLTKEEGLS